MKDKRACRDECGLSSRRRNESPRPSLRALSRSADRDRALQGIDGLGVVLAGGQRFAIVIIAICVACLLAPTLNARPGFIMASMKSHPATHAVFEKLVYLVL